MDGKGKNLMDQELKHANNFRNKANYLARVLSSGRVVENPEKFNLIKDNRVFTMEKNPGKFINEKSINGNVVEAELSFKVVVRNKFAALTNEEGCQNTVNEGVKEQGNQEAIEATVISQDQERADDAMEEVEEVSSTDKFDDNTIDEMGIKQIKLVEDQNAKTMKMVQINNQLSTGDKAVIVSSSSCDQISLLKKNSPMRKLHDLISHNISEDGIPLIDKSNEAAIIEDKEENLQEKRGDITFGLLVFYVYSLKHIFLNSMLRTEIHGNGKAKLGL
ncbi:hypothetical protein K7X08_011321 [Anisodus acutangulus]|uniref:Uncharacterized protein n=1 Tax=Anisodus acutangulus TaxID=402998 RepID=A0A9Q1LYH2_9SOLA|nr:hypothetical protein K7X08_011321 [Anisodus acutangulus]